MLTSLNSSSNRQAKIAQHDQLHPAPFTHPMTAATPISEPRSIDTNITNAADLTARAQSRTGRHPLTDRYKRDHGYLRISLTERCNLRCESTRYLLVLHHQSMP